MKPIEDSASVLAENDKVVAVVEKKDNGQIGHRCLHKNIIRQNAEIVTADEAHEKFLAHNALAERTTPLSSTLATSKDQFSMKPLNGFPKSKSKFTAFR